MSTKVKGLLKGLRYISQIFDEEKESDMKIGFPTDVKHVAHIGWDGNGPSADSPSWMKEFNTTTGYQSAPLAISGGGDSKENPEIKWVSEDLTESKSSRPSSSSRDLTSPADNPDSPTKKESSRRHSRRSKDASGNSIKSSRQPSDSASAAGSESPARSLPDIPKKTRRKKSKENVTTTGAGGSSSGSSRSSRSKEGGGSVRSRRDVDKSHTSNLKPSNQAGEMESNGIS